MYQSKRATLTPFDLTIPSTNDTKKRGKIEKQSEIKNTTPFNSIQCSFPCASSLNRKTANERKKRKYDRIFNSLRR
jgi:hypothetical protein